MKTGAGAARLFIATPTADGIVLAGYVAALAAMLGRLHAQGIATTYRTLDGSDLVAQRNRLTQAFLASDATHLLFIDSDMSFPPELAERLLAADKALIGTVYPKRALDLAVLRQQAGRMPFEQALALTYRWNLRPLPGGITVRDGLCRVEGVGGGFLMIRRDCFETLLASGSVPLFADGEGLHAFFRDTRQGREIIDLDYSFCREWIRCGGEVWADVTADIVHIGDGRHSMPYLAFLEAQGAPARRSGDAPV